MAGVYSTRFWLGEALEGVTELYTVPEGRTAVLRDIDGTPADGSQDYFLVAINGVYVITVGLLQPAGSVAGYMQWNGRAVLNAGDVVSVLCSADIRLQLSGYLLNTT